MSAVRISLVPGTCSYMLQVNWVHCSRTPPPLFLFIQSILIKGSDIFAQISLYDSAMPGSFLCSSTVREAREICVHGQRGYLGASRWRVRRGIVQHPSSRVLKKSASRGWDGPVSPLCSRNARSQKTLVGRAQWGTHPGHQKIDNITSKLGRTIFGRSLRAFLMSFVVSCRAAFLGCRNCF
jgi:hypothetical protein